MAGCEGKRERNGKTYSSTDRLIIRRSLVQIQPPQPWACSVESGPGPSWFLQRKKAPRLLRKHGAPGSHIRHERVELRNWYASGFRGGQNIGLIACQLRLEPVPFP